MLVLSVVMEIEHSNLASFETAVRRRTGFLFFSCVPSTVCCTMAAAVGPPCDHEKMKEDDSFALPAPSDDPIHTAAYTLHALANAAFDSHGTSCECTLCSHTFPHTLLRVLMCSGMLRVVLKIWCWPKLAHMLHRSRFGGSSC